MNHYSSSSVGQFLAVTASVLFAGTACSDPAQLPPEGGYTIQITPQSGMSCSGTGPPFSVPSGNDPFAEIQNPQSIQDTSKETPESFAFRADGEEGFEVSCSVEKTGDGSFEVNAELVSNRVRFAVSGQLMGQSSTAFISELHQPGAGSSSGGVALKQDDCTVTIRTRSDGTGVVGSGFIWADYECPKFENVPNDFCVGKGTFVFQNCSD